MNEGNGFDFGSVLDTIGRVGSSWFDSQNRDNQPRNVPPPQQDTLKQYIPLIAIGGGVLLVLVVVMGMMGRK